MHTKPTGPDPGLDPSRGFEQRDLDPVKMLPWLFGIVVFVAVASVSALGIFRLFASPYNGKNLSAYPLPTVRTLPAPPVLQANPRVDIRQLRAQDRKEETSYYVGPKGHLHIPIKQAMLLVEQQGLPTRPNPVTPDKNSPNEPAFTSGQATAQENEFGFASEKPLPKVSVTASQAAPVPSQRPMMRMPASAPPAGMQPGSMPKMPASGPAGMQHGAMPKMPASGPAGMQHGAMPSAPPAGGMGKH